MAKNVVFDEDSAARIAAAVKWVEQYSLDETQDEETQDDPGADAAARSVIRGMFYGVWGITETADVSYTADNGDENTKTATNYFATVGESETWRNCCIVLVGTEWILIAAQCEDIPPVENVID